MYWATQCTNPHCGRSIYDYQGRGKLFSIGGRGGGAESEGRRPEEIFKFRVSEMPFPELWGRFDRILMVRKQRFSMSKFTI
jgi:hypothetical protein